MAVTQSHYRFGINSGTESTHGWHANEDANPSQGTIAVDTTFLLRFCLQCDATLQSNVDPEFQYRLNGGTWTNITTTSNVVRAVTTAVFANADHTTQRLSGTGTFEASSQGCTHDGVAGGAQMDIVANGNAETECSMQIRSVDVVHNDVIEFRLTRDGGTLLDTYAVTPSLTVSIVVSFVPPQYPGRQARRQMSTAQIACSGMATMDADLAISPLGLSSVRYPHSTRRAQLPTACLAAIAEPVPQEAGQPAVTYVPPTDGIRLRATGRVMPALEMASAAIEQWAVPLVSWAPSIPDRTRRVTLTVAEMQVASAWTERDLAPAVPPLAWAPVYPDRTRRVVLQTAAQPTGTRSEAVEQWAVPALSWAPSVPASTRRLPARQGDSASTERTMAAPQTVDFVFTYADPVRQVRARRIQPHVTWYEELNWQLIAMASARYPQWALRRPGRAVPAVPVRSFEAPAPQVVNFVFDFSQPIRPLRAKTSARQTTGSYAERDFTPPPIVSPLGSWDRPVLRRRSVAHLLRSEHDYGYEIDVPVMSWESYTSLYPSRTWGRRGQQTAGVFPVQAGAPQAPDLSWQPEYMDGTRRAALLRALLPWTARGEALEQLAVPHLSWRPQFTDTTRRGRLGTAQMQPPLAYTDRELVAVAPALSWQPDYPDITRRLRLPDALLPWTGKGEAIEQWSVPPLSWGPSSPDRTRRVRLATAVIQAAMAYTDRDLVAAAPDLSWQPAYPDGPPRRLMLRPAQMHGATAYTDREIRIPELSWHPRLVDRPWRPRLEVSRMPFSVRGEALEQFSVPDLSWQPAFALRPMRRRLETALIPSAFFLMEITDAYVVSLAPITSTSEQVARTTSGHLLRSTELPEVRTT